MALAARHVTAATRTPRSAASRRIVTWRRNAAWRVLCIIHPA
jgi:hypothetical protein